MVLMAIGALLDLKEIPDSQVFLAYLVLKDVHQFHRNYQGREDHLAKWVFKDHRDGMESQALLDLLVIQELWVQMVKKACQVSLEYQEIQASMENLDK